MRYCVVCIFLIVVGLVGFSCGDDDTSTSSDTDSDADTDTDTDTDTDSDTDTDTDSDTDSGYSFCMGLCDTLADCEMGEGAYSEDNFSCDDGYCYYLGCYDDGECEDTFGKGYGCSLGLHSVAYCTPLCDTAADCSQDIEYADEDNFECDQGYCLYLGCLSDEECAEASGKDHGCGPHIGYYVNTCVVLCDTIADCSSSDSAVYGEDNYECNDGYCYWLGCNDDQECEEEYGEEFGCFEYPM